MAGAIFDDGTLQIHRAISDGSDKTRRWRRCAPTTPTSNDCSGGTRKWNNDSTRRWQTVPIPNTRWWQRRQYFGTTLMTVLGGTCRRLRCTPTTLTSNDHSGSTRRIFLTSTETFACDLEKEEKMSENVRNWKNEGVILAWWASCDVKGFPESSYFIISETSLDSQRLAWFVTIQHQTKNWIRWNNEQLSTDYNTLNFRIDETKSRNRQRQILPNLFANKEIKNGNKSELYKFLLPHKYYCVRF